MDKQRYMISDAAAIVNVESHVLRYWEEELELAVPRNEMGHRYYTKENINQFLQIKELKEQGYQLKAIRMILHNEEMDQMDEIQPMQMNQSSVSSQTISSQMVPPQTNQRPTATMMQQNPAHQVQVTNNYSNQTKLDQFQEMMNQIVKKAIEENNRALGQEVGEQVGDRVLKEMNYLMREQDEQEEARYRKLDEAIRGLHKKKEKNGKMFGKKQELNPTRA